MKKRGRKSRDTAPLKVNICFGKFANSFLLHQRTLAKKKMLFCSVFLKTHKKPYKPPKTAEMAFVMVNNFFCAFSKVPTTRTCVRLLFLKMNQSLNTKKIFFGGFSSKTKNALFRGSKMVLFTSQISNLYFCVCSLL